MREIQDHKIYELLKTKYDRIGLDYVILQLGNYEGEKNHKTAVIPRAHAYDDSFTQLSVDWKDNRFEVKSSAVNDGLYIQDFWPI